MDRLSSFERIRHLSLERILPPSRGSSDISSEWTCEGRRYLKECKEPKEEVKLQAGIHYVAVDAPGRIIMPDLEIAQGLPHKWF